MNSLALELNNTLAETVAGRLLSDFGRHIFFPRGIVAQSNEASSKAKRFNATIGMAVENKQPMALDAVRSQVPELSLRELVAYSPTGGLLPLRENWKVQMLSKNPDLKKDHCSLPMVVPGLTNGIFHAAELFIDKEDAVIIPDMHWDNYELLIGVRRQATVHSFPFFDKEKHFNVPELSEVITEIHQKQGKKKLVLLLNFPNNPTGYTPTETEARNLCRMLTEHAENGLDILVICDDAYFGLYYEKNIFSQSLFAPLSSAHERIMAIKVDGSTKEDFVWGFRLGFFTFGGKALKEEHYQALASKLTGSIRACVSSSSSIGQAILEHAYANPDFLAQKSAARQKLERRYHVARRMIDAYERADSPYDKKRKLYPLPFNSGYFMAFECRGISAESLRQALLQEGIGTISLKDTFLRVAYSAVDETDIPELFEEIFRVAENVAE